MEPRDEPRSRYEKGGSTTPAERAAQRVRVKTSGDVGKQGNGALTALKHIY
jgi:hypothetical protein